MPEKRLLRLMRGVGLAVTHHQPDDQRKDNRRKEDAEMADARQIAVRRRDAGGMRRRIARRVSWIPWSIPSVAIVRWRWRRHHPQVWPALVDRFQQLRRLRWICR